MICRLCLINIPEENAVELFKADENDAETQPAQMIAMHFQLELLPDDTVSKHICLECCEQIRDFHTFWVYIDLKQTALRNELSDTKSESEEEDSKLIKVEFAEHPESLSGNECGEEDLEDYVQFGKEQDEDMEEVASDEEILNEDDGKSEHVWNDTNDGISQEDMTFTISNVEIVDSDSDYDPKKDRNSARPEKLSLKRTSIQATESKQARLNKSIEDDEEKELIIMNYMKIKCDLCGNESENFRELRLHFLSKHELSEPYLICCDTKYTFRKLVNHIKWHQNGEILSCEVCDKKYRSKKCFEKHILEHKTRSYKCESCNKSFSRLYNLNRHNYYKHEERFPFICDTCGKRFKIKALFERHLREHQGIVEDPEQCSVCGEWLKNKRRLAQHKSKHTIRDHQCILCGRACATRKALEGHIRYWHKREKDLKCEVCSKMFKLESSLKEHLATHTGSQLYSCPHCPKESRSKANMYVHIKRCHVEEWVKSKRAKSYDPQFLTKKDAE